MRQRPPPQRASSAAASTPLFVHAAAANTRLRRYTIGSAWVYERRRPPFAGAQPCAMPRRGPETSGAREDQRPAPHPVPGPHSAYFTDCARYASAFCRSAACSAWMAVRAIVKTMSSTRQPRLRSFTGFARPCSIGPMLTTLALRWTAL